MYKRLFFMLLLGMAFAAPSISWNSPTPENGEQISVDWVELDAEISDSSGTSASLDWDDSLVAYWSFDQHDSMGIQDHSSHGNDGEFHGSLSEESVLPGRFGDGLEFMGNCSDYIEIQDDDSLQVNGDLTISFWWRIQGNRHNGVIAKRYVYSEYYVEIRPSDNRIGLYHGNGTQCEGCYESAVHYYSPFDYGTYTWHHSVFTRNATHGSYYEDGEHKTDREILQNIDHIAVSDEPVLIGLNYRGVGPNCRPFNGTLDELRVYNRVISEEEILALYDSGLNKLEARFDGIDEGVHEYTAWAINEEGEITSDTREVTYSVAPQDSEEPEISWDESTPEDEEVINVNWAYLDAVISDDSEASAFIDWENSLLGYWSFDVDNGTHVLDLSGNEQHILFDEGTTSSDLSQGKRGIALNLDGSGFMRFDEPVFDYDDALTVEAWFKVSNFKSGYPDILDFYHDNCRIELGSELPSVGFVCYTQDLAQHGVSSGQVLEEDEWYHVCGVVESNKNISVYLDGELISEEHFPGEIRNDASVLLIGTGSTRFEGSVDEIRFHGRALSPSEIKASFDSSNGLYNNFTNLSEGEHFYSVWAIDEQGNSITESRQFSFEEFQEPETETESNLSVSLVSPSDGLVTQDTNFTFTFTVDGDGNAACDLYLNDEIVQSMDVETDGNQKTFSHVLEPGEYSWFVECEDVLDDDSSREWDLTVEEFENESVPVENPVKNATKNETIEAPPPPENTSNKTEVPVPVCGNLIKEEGEECDGMEGVPNNEFYCKNCVVARKMPDDSTMIIENDGFQIGGTKIAFTLLAIILFGIFIAFAVIALFFYKKTSDSKKEDSEEIDELNQETEKEISEIEKEKEEDSFMKKPSVTKLDDLPIPRE